jgi:hypothetical protein
MNLMDEFFYLHPLVVFFVNETCSVSCFEFSLGADPGEWIWVLVIYFRGDHKSIRRELEV